jgi:hypothetical protein
VALGEQETDTGWVHDSLLHWETLLVVAAGDSEDVALEFISNAITWDLCAHSVGIISISSLCPSSSPRVPLVHEDTQLLLIFNLDQLLAAVGRLFFAMLVL